MTEAKQPCPKCGKPMAPVRTLKTTDGGRRWEPFMDPADGAQIVHCPDHGRAAVHRDGSVRLEAKRGRKA